MNHKHNIPEPGVTPQAALLAAQSAAGRKVSGLLPSAALLALGTGLTAIFYYVGHQPDLKNYVPEFIALILLGGIPYLLAVYIVWHYPLGPAALFIILSSGVAFRLLVLPAAPQLSDDVYRYQWEGRIQRARINPYTVYPALADLEKFQDPAHPLRAGQYTPTVYPPLSEKAFSWVETVTAYKRLFTALDLASMGVLLTILAALKQPVQHVLVYVWNPTVVISFAMCGHHDSLAIFTVLAATWLIITRRQSLSAAFLALSALSKFFAVLLVPVFFKLVDEDGRMRPSPCAADAAAGRTAPANAPGSRPVTRRLLFSWIFAGIVVLGYMPYAGAGRHVLGGLRNYAAVWEANDSVFRLVRLSGNSQAQAELVIAIMLLGLLAYVLRAAPRLLSQPCPRQAFHSAPPDSPSRIGDPRLYLLRSALILLAGLVLLSPDAFPWYFTWSIPFLCFWPSAPWLLMSVTAVLGYAPVVAYAAGQPYVHSPFMLALEYGPVMLWLAWIGTQRLRAHTIEGRARFF